MRAALSAALLLLSPLPLAAQTHKPNVFYFGRAHDDGPAIGVETRSGSVRDTLGVLVIGITPNGPADKAGIEEGDRIASANGIDLRLAPADATDREMRGLMSRRLARAVQKVKAGDVVELRVYHDGQYKTVKVTTVKAADLAVDDEGFGHIEMMPEIQAGELLEDMPDVHFAVPDAHALDLPMSQLQRIKIELPKVQPYMRDMRRSLEKLKTMPIEIYEDGIHRI